MKNTKKIITLLFSIFLLFNIFAEDNIEENGKKQPKQDGPRPEVPQDENIVFGKVLSIDDDSITIEKIKIIEQKTEETYSIDSKVKVYETSQPPLPPHNKDDRDRKNRPDMKRNSPENKDFLPKHDGNLPPPNTSKEDRKQPKKTKANYTDIAPGAIIKIELNNKKTAKAIYIQTNPMKNGNLSENENQ